MKVFNAFAQLFAILAFLTMGSLLVIVALHILSVDDAIFKIREVYASPMKSFQTGVVGLIFIFVGLAFSKMMVKKGRDAEAVIFQSELGPMVVTVSAMEDVAKRVLKKCNVIKEYKMKTLIHGRDVEIKIRLVLWAASNVPRILSELQDEIHMRVSRLLGSENKLEVICEVQHIEDQGGDVEPEKSEAETAGSI